MVNEMNFHELVMKDAMKALIEFVTYAFKNVIFLLTFICDNGKI